MQKSSLLNKAIELAVEAHAHQKRADQVTPFIVHPVRVAALMPNSRTKTIALLHDVIEDTELPRHLIKDLLGNDIASSINALTHKKGEMYSNYIERLIDKGDSDAVLVKLADIFDNLSDNPSDHYKVKTRKAMKMIINYIHNRIN